MLIKHDQFIIEHDDGSMQDCDISSIVAMEQSSQKDLKSCQPKWLM